MGDPSLQKTIVGPLSRQIYLTTDHRCCLFRARMHVCADGAPKAYHPKPQDKLGLDDLAAAGLPDNNWAIATDANGNLCIQKNNEPAPGFYVSMTAYANPGVHDSTLQIRYVDASSINYIVLPSPMFKKFIPAPGIQLGNVGFVYSPGKNTFQFAIAGEAGPNGEIGEASLQLVLRLGYGDAKQDARSGGTEKPEIIYGVFPSVTAAWPLSQSQIDTIGAAAFQAWGDRERLTAIAPEIA
jgi:hypothetical protein